MYPFTYPLSYLPTYLPTHLPNYHLLIYTPSHMTHLQTYGRAKNQRQIQKTDVYGMAVSPPDFIDIAR